MPPLLKSILSYLKHAKVHLVLHKTWLDAWDIEADDVPTRLVERIQLCWADTSRARGVSDEWDENVDHIHTHSLIRAFLAPTADLPQEIVLLERIPCSNKGSHSVVAIDSEDTRFKPGTLAFPEFNAHVCVIRQGSVKDLVPSLHVNLSVDPSGMTLKDFVAIVKLVEGTGLRMPLMSGQERAVCEQLASSFAFNCFVALVPSVLPSAEDDTRESGEKVNAEAMRASGLERLSLKKPSVS